MFDLRDPASTRIKRAEAPIPAARTPAKPEKRDPLDSPKAVETWQRMLDTYQRELDRQEANRTAMAVDEDFKDGIQWSEADAQALEERGQKPLVFNVIATTVNWILGTEKRGRSDFKVLPRRKEDAKPAERKSQILKYLSDCNRTGFHRSRAFADAVTVGIGWLEDCYEEDGDGEPIVSRYESWRNMLWDSAAQELDLKDARYVMRSKWVDLDVAQAIFPNRTGVLDLAARDAEPLSISGEYGDAAMDSAELELERVGSSSRMADRYARERVRIIEAWFRTPQKVQRLSGGAFTGEIFDPSSRGHVDSVESGEAELVDRTAMRVQVALFTVSGLLWLGPSPYRHNRFPFTPIWGNRRGRDGLPYGIVRSLKDLNEDINKRASKALHVLSSRLVVTEQGAVEDHDETAEEISRSDAYVVLKDGNKKFDVKTEIPLAEAQERMMGRTIAMVQQVGGVTDENLGKRTNATSGIAIERRQVQGAMATTHYFDHLRLATQIQGENQLALVEQFMVEKKAFRITNLRGKPEYISVNDGQADNDIFHSKADFTLSEADWRASLRQAQSEELTELLIKLAPVQPQLVMVMLDLVVESTDIANREEIVRRIREQTGMTDPDADEPSPEEAARAKAQQEAQERQRAAEDAQLRNLIAGAVEREMRAHKLQAETARVNLTSVGGSGRGAIDIAADTMTAPALAPVADEILRDAGYVGRAEKEHAAAQAAQQQQQQAAEAAAQPAQGAPE